MLQHSLMLAALAAALVGGGGPVGVGGGPERGTFGGDEGLSGVPLWPDARVATFEAILFADYSLGPIEWDVVPTQTWGQDPIVVTQDPALGTPWNGLGMQTQLVHPTTLETAFVESSMEGNSAAAAEMHRARVGALLDQGFEVQLQGFSSLVLVPELADLVGVTLLVSPEEGTFTFSRTVYHNVPHSQLGWVEVPTQVGYTTSPGEDPTKGFERFDAWVAREEAKGTFWIVPRNP